MCLFLYFGSLITILSAVPQAATSKMKRNKECALALHICLTLYAANQTTKREKWGALTCLRQHLCTVACCWKENDAWQKSPSTVVRKPTKVSAELRLMWFPNESEPLGGITQIFKVGHHPRCCRSSSMRSFFSVKVLPGHFGHIICRLWYNNVIIRWPAWLSCRITPWPPYAWLTCTARHSVL